MSSSCFFSFFLLQVVVRNRWVNMSLKVHNIKKSKIDEKKERKKTYRHNEKLNVYILKVSRVMLLMISPSPPRICILASMKIRHKQVTVAQNEWKMQTLTTMEPIMHPKTQGSFYFECVYFPVIFFFKPTL